MIKTLTWWIWTAVCGCIFIALAGIAGLNGLIPEFLAEVSMPIKVAAALAAIVLAWVITDVAYHAYRKEINRRILNIFYKEERK